jgi:hypothetical protein
MEKGHKPHTLEYFPYYSFSRDSFVHYTCNAPSIEVLIKHNITPLGSSFGCINDAEVLEIPMNVYKKAGFRDKLDGLDKATLTLNLERLMRELK